MKTLKPHEERRAERRALDITQKDLARKIGVSESLLCRWESGEREPTPEQLRDWRTALRERKGRG